jgi:sulfide:quinone oxidoreductase
MAPELEVVVCGGGIAGVEGLLRMRRLGGHRLRLTLVSPGPDLVYRPLAVREPLGLPGMRRYPLERIAAAAGARWMTDRLAWVDDELRTVRTEGGEQLRYDALLLAIGARESSPFEHAHVLTGRDGDKSLAGIINDIQLGYVRSVAFVLPREWVWPMPLYELALMTSQRARSTNADAQITLITSEGRPLKAFGQAAGDAVVALLQEAGIELHAGVTVDVPRPRVVAYNGTELEAERIVTLPKLTGPAIQGIPAGERWFVPIDERCLVPGTSGRIFAAGDATEFPIKQGGIGAQQADTAAAGIAHLAGLAERPPPFDPVIRGMLLTGERPLYMAARVVAGLGWQSEVYEQPPWPAEDKIVADELGPYLNKLEPAAIPRP